MPMAESSSRRADIDVKLLLSDVLASYDLEISEEKDDFLIITGGGIPEGCTVFFLMKNEVPPYAARALSTEPLCVVIHVRNDWSDAETADLTAGIFTLRLKDIGELDRETLEERVMTASLARRFADSSGSIGPSITDIAHLVDSFERADPDKIVEYATTEEDSLFEAATAKIIRPLVDHVIVLGDQYRGKSVPDGILLQTVSNKKEIACYDCKSKKGDDYDFPPEDADKQSRYLQFENFLFEEDPASWVKRGIVLFTPTIAPDRFLSKTARGPWTSFVSNGGRMTFVTAHVLARWHALTKQEPKDKFELLFDHAKFWQGLVLRKLASLNGLSPALQRTLMPDITSPIHVLTIEEAEMIWLSGFAREQKLAAMISKGLKEIDPTVIGEKVARPVVTVSFFEALRKNSKVTIDQIAHATSLTPHAVKYMILADDYFYPNGLAEQGTYGARNYGRIREELLR